jgi:hypothetical protein
LLYQKGSSAAVEVPSFTDEELKRTAAKIRASAGSNPVLWSDLQLDGLKLLLQQPRSLSCRALTQGRSTKRRQNGARRRGGSSGKWPMPLVLNPFDNLTQQNLT